MGHMTTSGDDARAQRERLKSVRKAYGITQGQLAKLIGVSRREVQNWETGKRSVHHRLSDIAAALGCAEIDLLNIDGPIPPATTRRSKKPAQSIRTRQDNIIGLLVTQIAAMNARMDTIEWRLDRLAGKKKQD
jgi:transcriptional regulator with XRE-family HTH domain